MTMLPGQPRRPRVPPLPPGWTHVTREAPPAAWTGLPRPQTPAQPRIPPAPYEYIPIPTGKTAPPPAPPQGAGARFLRGNAKVIAVVLGMTLTLLVMIEGLGVPQDARDIVAVMIAGLTPIAVYLIPDYKPPPKGGTHGN